jgi:hypothetical protein
MSIHDDWDKLVFDFRDKVLTMTDLAYGWPSAECELDRVVEEFVGNRAHIFVVTADGRPTIFINQQVQNGTGWRWIHYDKRTERWWTDKDWYGPQVDLDRSDYLDR